MGYIGSHTVLQLIENGYKVSILDNLANASQKVKNVLEEIAKCHINFFNADVKNEEMLKMIFKQNSFDGVIHFAGLKSVSESAKMPLEYYECNVGETIALLKAMRDSNLKTLVFSSSATVYKAKDSPICENDSVEPSNPYGKTKLVIEQILQDLYASDKTWKISILRYFNPVGCHESCKIGESPSEPSNILPYIQQVAVGRKKQLYIFGNDWNTVDGTGVRDYLHVMDLADGHIAAFKALIKNDCGGCCNIYNFGTGKGISVMELKRFFEDASEKQIPFVFTKRRSGDLGSVIANPSKAEKELNWKATRTIQEACKSAWIWQSTHPYGFDDSK